jgi:nucleotide-binding universal stress UspA family protein
MYRNILIALDGSRTAENSLPTAIDLAARSGARLHLASVVSREGDLTDMKRAGSPGKYLNGVAKRVRSRGNVEIEVALLADKINDVVYGKPPRPAVADVLEEYARKYDMDLVLMTTHGRGGIQRAWLGSVADSFLRNTSRTVLLFKGRSGVSRTVPVSFGRILIPVGEQNRAEEAIARAVALGEIHEAQYTLLHVAPAPTVLLASGFADELLDVPEDRASVDTRLERLAATMRESGHTVTTHVAEAPFVANEIIAQANAGGFDAVAMATAGPASVERVFLGSVADKVIRKSELPTLCCSVRD